MYTYVFAPGDEPHVEQAANAYEAVGGSVLFVQLVASSDELLRRVVDPGRRSHGKIADVDTLRALLREHDLFTAIPGRESLTIDAEALQPSEAADRIGEALTAAA